MHEKYRVLGRGWPGTPPDAEADLYVVMGIALNIARRDEVIERGHTRRRGDVTSREGGASGIPAGASVGGVEFAAGAAERHRQSALRRIVIIPEGQRPAG